MTTIARTTTNAVPATYTDPSFGISDPELVKLVAIAVSRSIGNQSLKGPYVERLQKLLRLYANTPSKRGGVDMPHPEIEKDAPCSNGKTCARRIGKTPRTFAEYWEEVDDSKDTALPTDELCQFLPPELWKVVATIIEDGPGRAVSRVERFLKEERQREVTPTRARPAGGKISQGHLDTLSRSALHLFDVLCDLRPHLDWARTYLERWDGVPHLVTPLAEVSQATDTSAPPLHLIRATWAQLDTRVAEKLGGAALGQEIEVLLGWSQAKLLQRGLFKLVRDRVLLLFVCAMGARADSITRILRRDYDRARRSPDGHVGPAVAVFPEKTNNRNELSWKPIPVEWALVIETYIWVVEKLQGEPMNPDGPLLVAGFSPARRHTPLGYTGLHSRVAGKRTKNHPSGSVRAMLPKGDDPYIGHAPHTGRGHAFQCAISPVAEAWCAEKRIPFKPLSLAQALVDHKKLVLDEYGYGGVKKREGREICARHALEINWLLVTTDLGARKVFDVDGFEELLRAQQQLLSQREKIREKLDILHAYRPPKTLTGDEKADAHMLNQSKAAELTLRERQLSDRLDEMKDEIKKFEDGEGVVSVADTLADTEIQKMATTADEVRQTLTESSNARRTGTREQRGWTTTTEWAYVAGVSTATARRHKNGKQLPYAPADPRRPWDEDSVPLDNTLGPKRERIVIAGVRKTYWTSDKLDRLAEILSTWPEGWSVEECHRPLNWAQGRTSDQG